MVKTICLCAMTLLFLTAVQSHPAEQARKLTAGNSRTLLVPPFGTWGEPVCDANGSLYFHLAASPSYNDIQVFRLSADGNEGTLFRLPTSLGDKSAFMSFAVSSSGSVFVLGEVIGGGFSIFSFSADGGLKKSTHLELPKDAVPRQFAALPNGTYLVFGHYGAGAPADRRGQRFAALFDNSGAMQKVLARDFGSVDIGQESNALSEGGVTVGDDGYAYLLTHNQVLALTPGGEIEARYKFEKPTSDAVPTRLNVSGNLAAIVFSVVNKHQLVREYLVFGINDGHTVGLYEPSAELGNGDVCFSQQEGFIFLSNDKRNKALVRTAVPLR